MGARIEIAVRRCAVAEDEVIQVVVLSQRTRSETKNKKRGKVAEW